MTADLSFFARPTPCDAAPRLAHALGLSGERLLVKRDDLIGLGGGGNKVRKLEVTMADALEAGAEVVVTTGAPLSNHARRTAAAAARCGLGCVLVLAGHAPGHRQGNLLLDGLLGAEVVFAGNGDTLLAEMGALSAGLWVDGTQIGVGYEHLTPATRDALALVAQTEGIVLDPTYSGRAMAGLVAAASAGSLPPGQVVFLYTGGLPGLF